MPDWIAPTIIGIAASGFFYWFGRFQSRSKMAYQWHHFTIVDRPTIKALGEIRILYRDVAVPRVVVTQLAVWNSGKTVIRGKDIVETHPLSICFGNGAVIFDAQRVSATQDVNDFCIRISDQDHSSAFLKFDYLNAGDGARFQIIHSGVPKEGTVTGSIRGLPRGLEYWGDLQEWREQKSRLSDSVSNLGISLLFTGTLFFLFWFKNLVIRHYPLLTKYANWLGWGVLALVGLLIASILVFVITYSIHTRSRATPKSLFRP